MKIKKRKRVKQATALALSAVMAMSGLPYLGTNSAYAWTAGTTLSSESDVIHNQNASIDKYAKVDGDTYYNSTESTAFKVGPGHKGTNGYSGHYAEGTQFNISAVKNESDRTNSHAGYTGIQTAYSNNWWVTRYAFGTAASVRPTVNWTGANHQIPKQPSSGAMAPAAALNVLGPSNTSSVESLSYRNGDSVVATGPNGERVEARVSLKKAEDDDNVIVEYTVYNPTASPVDFWMGSETDTQMDRSDDTPLLQTAQPSDTTPALANKPRGFAMFASHGTTGQSSATSTQFTDFMLLTQSTDSSLNLGMQKRNSTDPSSVQSWIGHYSTTAGVYHELFTMMESPATMANVGDSAAAFSAYFNLLPGETKTARFAIRMRVSVYYVDPTFVPPSGNPDDASNGFISRPFTSIQDAITKMNNAGVKKGYIALHGDVELNNTVEIPDGMDITFISSDFECPIGVPNTSDEDNYTAGVPQTHDNGTQFTIKRAAGFTNGPMFKIKDTSSDSTAISISNVTLDGNGGAVAATDAMIDAQAGTVRTRKTAILQNAKISPAQTTPKASAINIGGKARIDMSNGTVENNTSNVGGSAIIVNSNFGGAAATPQQIEQRFIASKDVKVTGNTSSDGSKANVQLGENNHIHVDKTRALSTTAKIGLNTTNSPTSNTMGTTAVVSDAVTGEIQPFSTSNFEADKNGNSSFTGTTVNPQTEGGTQDPLKIYLGAQMFALNIFYQDENGVSMDAPVHQNPAHANYDVAKPNQAVASNLDIAPPTITGYVYDPVETAAANSSLGSITIDSTGKVTGTMPGQNMNVIIRLKKNGISYKFDPTNGAAVMERYEPVTTSTSPSVLGAIPVVSRVGYNFAGWFEFTDNNGNGVYDAGEEVAGAGATALTGFPSPAAPDVKYYYARWNPGTGLYPLTTRHKNTTASLPLTFAMQNDNYTITTAVNKNPANVPGYMYNRSSRTPGSQGVLNLATGNYTVSMPPQGISLEYVYKVDPSHPGFTLTTEYVDGAGNVLKPAVTITRKPEARLSITPAAIANYSFQSVSITQGANDNPANYEVGLNTGNGLLTNLDTTTGAVIGYMPNQNVTIRYVYDATGASEIARRFIDDNMRTLYGDRNGVRPSSPVNMQIPTAGQLYGYVYDPSRGSRVDITPAGTAITADSVGTLTGTMPIYGGVAADYTLSKDMTKWQNIGFALTSNSLASATFSFTTSPNPVLLDDGVSPGHENASKFSEIKTEAPLPVVTPDRYYMVEGWYADQAGTQPIGDNDTLAMPAAGTQKVIYAKIVEDPSQWVDVNFASSDLTKGVLNPTGVNVPGGTPQHMHYDEVWSNLVKPASTPIANYELKNWTSPSGQIVQPGDTVVAGTYLANFGKVDATWGLNPGAFGANGRIGDNGQGTITITGTTPNNRYVVTDPDGNIIAVVDGPANGSDIQIPNVIPGRTYNVVEGGPDTQATVGQPGTSMTGSNISSPKPVVIPAIGDNRNVGVDPNDTERAQIVVNPADPDADYALIDSNGNVVPYPNSDNGWLTPVGSGPATVTFNNLNPGETYTVVARRHGNPSETPTGNLPAGVPVVANPGDMVDIQNYTIKTVTNAVGGNVGITSVDSNAVSTTDFGTAKGTSTFTLHADPTDSAGHAFKYWRIANGRIPGVTAKITSNDYTGTLDRSNVIFEAIYDVPATDAFGNPIAPASQENRGGAADGEFAMSADQISDLQNNLTNPTDQSLINVNHADVRYKIIFDKRNAENSEAQAVKNVPSQVWVDHPGAFTPGWALDVKEERYVDGRLVQNATPSDAQVNVNVQLASQDTDMLDYEIWDLGPTVDSTWTKITNPTYTSQISVVEDVANNGGLLSFVGNLNHTYVLVYSKTFKLNFIDNNPTKDHRYLGDTTRNFFKKIKVRKKDAVDDSWYTSDYAVVTGYADGATANTLVSPFDDIYGTTYTYTNWSKKDMPNNISIFDPSEEVTKTMNVYAYYDNNRPQVQQARKDLTSLIGQANDLVGDPFLKEGEAARLQAAIAEAQNVLDRIRGRLENGTDPLRMANYPELQDAINALRAVMDDLYGHSNRRSDRFNQRNNGAGGGSGSSGRGGGNVSGTPLQGTRYVNMPLQNTPQITFTLGVDGGWKINPTTNRWGFYLNGGLPLNNRWGRIDYVNANGQPVTDWYRFDEQSSLVTGWYYDKDDKQWYLLNPKEGSDQGKMIRGWYLDTTKNKWYFLNRDNGTMMTGWYHDPSDGKWYFFDPTTGEMYTGWAKINNKWYFFNQFASEPTWRLENDVWVYNNNNVRPFGSLYVSETTPDGYTVNSNGEWTN